MQSYCVFHDGNEFVIMNYNTFKENQDTSVIHFIGTYVECRKFINRSIAAQELVDSTNREHEDVDKLTEIAKRLANLYNIEYVNLYTREEVFLVAERSVRKAINNILTQEHTKISEIINSEIDTVKLF